MPFHRLDHVFLDAAAKHKEPGGAILRDSIIPRRRLEEKFRCRRLVLCDTDSIEQHDRIFDLGRNLAFVGALLHPFCRNDIILLHAFALAIEERQRIGGVGRAEHGGTAEIIRRLWESPALF